MPQPLVVGSGAAEAVIPRTWLSEPQDSRIRKAQVRCIPHDGRRQHCGKQRRENADRVNSRWCPIEEVICQVANVNKALGSVSKMVRNGNRRVFDTSRSYIENKMKKDILWLRERD